jgi:hypothetical protein
MRQSVGEDAYDNRSVKLNFSPYAFPYNESQTNIFSNDTVNEIMDAYFHFLMTVFDVSNKEQGSSLFDRSQEQSHFPVWWQGQFQGLPFR